MYSLGGKALTIEDIVAGFIDVVLEWYARSVSKLEDWLYFLYGSSISISAASNSFFFRELISILNALSVIISLSWDNV